MDTFSMGASLVVTEAGAAWPAWIEPCRGATGPRAIVQQEGEATETFAERVLDRIGALGARGIAPGVAIIACGDRDDHAAVAARRIIGRAILSVMASSGGGRLLFCAAKRSHARQVLTEIAADLGAEWDGTGAAPSVRFGHDGRCPQELVGSQTTAQRVA